MKRCGRSGWIAAIVCVMLIALAGCQPKNVTETEFRDAAETERQNYSGTEPQAGPDTEQGETDAQGISASGQSEQPDALEESTPDQPESSEQQETEPMINPAGFGEFLDNEWDYYGALRYPPVDYDGDGLTDTVFRTKNNEYGNDLYLLLGSGGVMQLDSYMTPDYNSQTRSRDMDGDGTPEFVYIRSHWSSDGGVCYIQMWERTDQGLQEMPFRYASGEETTGLKQIEIPLTLEKTEDSHMLVTQPELGITLVQPYYEDEFDHWGFKEGESGPIDSRVDSEKILALTDPDTGESKLRMTALVGDKWSSIYVVWEMIYDDGAWKVSDFSNGFAYENEVRSWSYSVDIDKTAAGIRDEASFDFEHLEQASIDCFQDGTIHIRLDQDIYYYGICELPKPEGLLDVAISFFAESIEAGAPETARLYKTVEGEKEYLVLEYGGETIWWVRESSDP